MLMTSDLITWNGSQSVADLIYILFTIQVLETGMRMTSLQKSWLARNRNTWTAWRRMWGVMGLAHPQPLPLLQNPCPAQALILPRASTWVSRRLCSLCFSDVIGFLQPSKACHEWLYHLECSHKCLLQVKVQSVKSMLLCLVIKTSDVRAAKLADIFTPHFTHILPIGDKL